MWKRDIAFYCVSSFIIVPWVYDTSCMTLLMRLFCLQTFYVSILVVLVDSVGYQCAITDLQYLLYIGTGCSNTWISLKFTTTIFIFILEWFTTTILLPLVHFWYLYLSCDSLLNFTNVCIVLGWESNLWASYHLTS
jgi:hypothetical protein